MREGKLPFTNSQVGRRFLKPRPASSSPARFALSGTGPEPYLASQSSIERVFERTNQTASAPGPMLKGRDWIAEPLDRCASS